MIDLPRDDGGDRRQRTKLLPPEVRTHTEAKKYLDAFREEVRKGIGDVRTIGGREISSNSTVAQFFEAWLSEIRDEVAEQTHANYDSHVKCHIEPVLGRRRLGDLNGLDIDRAQKKWAKTVSLKTVSNIRRTVSVALRRAQRWRLVEAPATIFAQQVHAGDDRRHRILTDDEKRRLLAALDEKSSNFERDRLFLLLAMTTAARRGEIFGLQVRDYDPRTNVLHIRRSIERVRNTESTVDELAPKMIPRTKAPKSERGIRGVPVVTEVASALEQWIAQLAPMESGVTRLRSSDESFPFADRNGEPLLPGVGTSIFKRAAAKAGLTDLRLHDLRHHAAAWLLAQGLSAAEVADILGHSSGAFTQHRYARGLGDRTQKKAAAALATILPNFVSKSVSRDEKTG